MRSRQTSLTDETSNELIQSSPRNFRGLLAFFGTRHDLMHPKGRTAVDKKPAESVSTLPQLSLSFRIPILVEPTRCGLWHRASARFRDRPRYLLPVFPFELAALVIRPMVECSSKGLDWNLEAARTPKFPWPTNPHTHLPPKRPSPRTSPRPQPADWVRCWRGSNPPSGRSPQRARSAVQAFY